MPISKLSVAVLASTPGAAGSTKAAPGATGAWINVSTYYGGDIGYSITNGASAPGVPMTIMFQTSPDNGTTVYDYSPVAGDIVAASVNTNTIWLDQGVMYLRAIAYGNTTNPVTAQVNLQAITAV